MQIGTLWTHHNRPSVCLQACSPQQRNRPRSNLHGWFPVTWWPHSFSLILNYRSLPGRKNHWFHYIFPVVTSAIPAFVFPFFVHQVLHFCRLVHKNDAHQLSGARRRYFVKMESKIIYFFPGIDAPFPANNCLVPLKTWSTFESGGQLFMHDIICRG